MNRTGGQMTYDSEDGYVLLFGGCQNYSLLGGCGRLSLGDTWTYRADLWQELRPTVSPSNRSGAGLVDDPAEGGVVLFGGTGPNGTLNDTWLFSAGTWTELATSPAPPRTSYAGMAYDGRDGKVVLFGAGGTGLGGGTQTWTFASGGWTNVTTPNGPPGMFDPFFAPSAAAGELVLEGGASALVFPTYYTQTWRFDGATDLWSNVSGSVGSANPGSRVADSGTYDPELNVTLLFGGGQGIGVDRDVWGYTANGTWTRYQGALESRIVLYDAQATWDAHDGYVVAIGSARLTSFYGLTEIAGITNQTWALTTTVMPSILGAKNVSTSATLDLTGNATGGVPPYRFNWSIGGRAAGMTPSLSTEFPSSGRYNISLNVTDSLNQTSSLTVRVTVNSTSNGGLLGSPPGLGGLSTLDLLVAAGAAAAIIAGLLAFARRRSRTAPTGAPPRPGPSGSPTDLGAPSGPAGQPPAGEPMGPSPPPPSN